MKSASQIPLSDVQAVYPESEARLWELLMGGQIHLGGFQSSMGLAQRAWIKVGWQGVDLCCCTGAGMRFLARFNNVAHMTGVDATPSVVKLGRRLCADEGYDGSLQRPVTHEDLRLEQLRFDNSSAALRLWNFLLTENERLHQARAQGDQIVGTMKDLGRVPVMAYLDGCVDRISCSRTSWI